jgi:transposase-like protein
VRWLERINESAAASLREGLEDALTVHRLGIGGTLRRTLVTTNPIESANDIVKALSRRVKHWRGSSMVLRWVGSGLVQAESRSVARRVTPRCLSSSRRCRASP